MSLLRIVFVLNLNRMDFNIPFELFWKTLLCTLHFVSKLELPQLVAGPELEVWIHVGYTLHIPVGAGEVSQQDTGTNERVNIIITFLALFTSLLSPVWEKNLETLEQIQFSGGGVIGKFTAITLNILVKLLFAMCSFILDSLSKQQQIFNINNFEYLCALDSKLCVQFDSGESSLFIDIQLLNYHHYVQPLR